LPSPLAGPTGALGDKEYEEDFARQARLWHRDIDRLRNDGWPEDEAIDAANENLRSRLDYIPPHLVEAAVEVITQSAT